MFQPGNTLGSAHKGKPKPDVRDARKASRSLAMAIRDGLDPIEVRDWLLAVWRGKDPLTGEIVPLEARERALRILLDRGHGQAAQMLVVDAQVTNEIVSAAPLASGPPMTLDEINARRAALRAALPALDAVATEISVAGAPR